MSQHRVHHMPPHHMRNNNHPLIYHHYGKYAHTRPYCFEWLKLNIRGRKEVHAKKKSTPNTTLTSSVEHRGSSSKIWCFNTEGTKHMARDKTSHTNHAEGRIKGSRRMVIPRLEKVPVRRDSSTNVNQHYIKGKEIYV